MKIVVMASGAGSTFEAICNAIKDKILIDVEITGLIYNVTTAGVAEIAASRGIPRTCVDHKAFKTRKAFDKAVARCIKKYNPDLVVMAGWMRIATSELIDKYPNRIINIHPSLLPSFKGIDAVSQALAAGVKITGCTAHIVTEKLDDGPIIAQYPVPVMPTDDVLSLHNRIKQAEKLTLIKAISDWRNENYRGFNNAI